MLFIKKNRERERVREETRGRDGRTGRKEEKRNTIAPLYYYYPPVVVVVVVLFDCLGTKISVLILLLS